MNKQELIEKYNGKLNVRLSLQLLQIYKDFIHDLQQLDEPQKVVVPQFVAAWIENVKENGLLKENFSGNRIGISVGDDVQRVLYFIFQKRIVEGEVLDWILDNTNTFARAWLDGYEVEKEKRFTVKVKGICGNHETLNREKHSNKWLFSDREENSLYDTHHTRKELEEAGFGWVFDCPGIEIEEVE